MLKTIITILVIHISLLMTAQENTETIIPLEEYYDFEFQHIEFIRLKNGVLKCKSPIKEPLDYVYYKDTNNRMDNFVGNWVFNDGFRYLKIEIIKQTHVVEYIYRIKNHNYKDNLLIYIQYKENGVEIYNTIDQHISSISGNIILSNNKMEMHYSEPSPDRCKRRNSSVLEMKLHTFKNI